MKDKIKEIFINLGADVCGIANVDLFIDTPKGFHPIDIFSECKSVIVFAKKIPKGLACVSPRIIYQQFNSIGPVELHTGLLMKLKRYMMQLLYQFHLIVHMIIGMLKTWKGEVQFL